MHMYLLATLQHGIAGDKATYGLLELEFVVSNFVSSMSILIVLE